MKIKDALAFLVPRMKEASSYSGMAMTMLATLHVGASPDLVNAGLGVIAALGGLLAIFIPEKDNAHAADQ